ncbi:hypothetical protein [Cohnella panacarvi]|uniref:hypothetical protein n=1 Tax=Cohnella panacarvi TaxID=400776 RepID=UPI00047C5720|nr:hypothetical protein [Cohnella panacarvi]
MKIIEVLIISNSLDFGTDYVCLELEKRNAQYLRLNRDDFARYEITLDVNKVEIHINIDGIQYIISEETLRSVYYRAPIYLRDVYQSQIEMDVQLYRTQWTAFIRNLTILETVKWVNNPAATFIAENKLLQLKYAKTIGFSLPDTYVANTNKISLTPESLYIVKSLDTAVLRVDGQEAFIYSNLVSTDEIKNASLGLSPVVIQNYIGAYNNKVDVRVTVIEEKIFSVRIIKNGAGIEGDWRREKDEIEYVRFELPDDVKSKCVDIAKKFGLSFGAIDLIESNGEFYFLEINPTGEWAWLVESAELPIHEEICKTLVGYS